MTAEFMVAVHALEFLNHKGTYLSSEEIAQNVCTNPARVRKVLSRLEKHELVTAKNGHLGGYAFAGDPKQVTLLEVFRAVGVTVLKSRWRSGDVEMDCAVASGMAGVMDEVFGEMERGCEDTLGRITIADIDERLFGASRKPENAV